MCFVTILSCLADSHVFSTVDIRQHAMKVAARRTNQLIREIFPANVRDRLLFHTGDAELDQGNEKFDRHDSQVNRHKASLSSFLSEGDKTKGGIEDHGPSGAPIADLFPETTVMFGDIAGFTAWSSVREVSSRDRYQRIRSFSPLYLSLTKMSCFAGLS